MLQLLDSGLMSVFNNVHFLGNHLKVFFPLTRLVTDSSLVLILQRNEFRSVALCVLLRSLVKSLTFGLIKLFELGERLFSLRLNARDLMFAVPLLAF